VSNALSHLYTLTLSGSESKQRVVSRPSSTLSFPPAALYSPSPAPEFVGYHTHQEVMERFNARYSSLHSYFSVLIIQQALVRDLEAVVSQMPVHSHEASLPPNHDIRHIAGQILALSTDAADRQRTPLMMSQKIVQLLYKSPSQLGKDIYVTLLGRLCRQFEEVEREALTWLLYAEDEVSRSV
jgi:CCR4-NOT transcription complex subunit 1